MSATALLRENPSPTRRRDREGDPGQHLPLHRLLEHLQGGQGGVRPGGRRVSETTTVAEPLVVEQTETKPGYAGQSVPRKEDKRLVQGEGVFFDDVKRHNMGYVHFVRSPYAHAKHPLGRRLEGARAPRRARHADRGRGRAADRPVLPDLLAAGRAPEGLLPRRRQGALRRRAGRRGGGDDARDRPRRLRARRGRLRAAARRSPTRARRSPTTRRSCTTTPGRT